MRPTNQSCSPGSLVTSSYVPKGAFWKCACFLAAPCSLPRCDGSIAHRNQRFITSFRSGTGMRSSHPLPTGFEKPTNYVTEWPGTSRLFGPYRHPNLDASKKGQWSRRSGRSPKSQSVNGLKGAPVADSDLSPRVTRNQAIFSPAQVTLISQRRLLFKLLIHPDGKIRKSNLFLRFL